MESDGRYYIPLHEFTKAAILGDFAYYNPASSLAANLFDVQNPDEREHFLAPLIIEFLNTGSSPKDKDGFVAAVAIVVEMQAQKYSEQQTEGILRRLTNKKLIETTQRVTFDESSTGLVGEMPYAFRLTSVGLYHTQRWLATFAYLDAMLSDTPIFDDQVFQGIATRIGSHHIAQRLERTLEFRTYLSSVWNRSGVVVPYFDWEEVVARDAPVFADIQRAVQRVGNNNKR
jgi:hypothetical protein